MEISRAYQAQCDLLTQEKTEWTSTFRGLLTENTQILTGSLTGSHNTVQAAGVKEEPDIFNEGLMMEGLGECKI